MIPVLFARSDSVYKTIPGCDVYDLERNALNYQDSKPVITHPPCRLWGRLSHFSTAPASEKDLATWAVRMIRKNGGVLEHPAHSTLWKAMNMSKPGQGRDIYGGFSIEIKQFWWGHRADKKTWLYICKYPHGRKLPDIPFVMGEAPCVVDSSKGNKLKRGGKRKTITKAEREHTPVAFAHWLISVINIINEGQND